MFGKLKATNLKLNPGKSTIGVGAGKFLGFMVSSRGIHVNPEKVEAISRMASPKTIKDVQRLTGSLAALSRFLSKGAERQLPFFNILRKAKRFEWSEECEEAF